MENGNWKMENPILETRESKIGSRLSLLQLLQSKYLQRSTLGTTQETRKGGNREAKNRKGNIEKRKSGLGSRDGEQRL
jgi:hypothetical protein